MKVSKETKDIIGEVKWEAFEIQGKIRAMLNRLNQCPGTIKDVTRLQKSLAVLDVFIGGR